MKKLFLFAIFALTVSFLILKGRADGVEFILTNVGADPLRSVTVHVTGKTYGLGDLLLGSTKSITVNPTSESHIEITYSDNRRLKIDCYFESGYGGKVTAKVTAHDVVEVKDEVQLQSYF